MKATKIMNNKSRPFLRDIKPHGKDLSDTPLSPQPAMGYSGKRRDKGIVLIVVFVCVIVLAISVTGFMRLSGSEIIRVRRQNQSTKAFYLADAGIERVIAWLRVQPTIPFSTQAFNLNEGEGTISVPSVNATLIPGTGMSQFIVESTGTVGGISREIEATIQTESFAKWSYFSNSESALIHWWWWVFEVPVWFTSGSYLEGPVHTNGQFNVSGTPIFNGPVSGVDNNVNYMHSGPPTDEILFYNSSMPDYDQVRDLRFESDELTLGVTTKDISSLTANSLKNAAANGTDNLGVDPPVITGGVEFSGDTTIEFLSDGTMNVTNNHDELGWVDKNVSIPPNGALFVNDGELKISGTLNGQLTVGASADVIITDDILYNSDPRSNPSSTDMLGIISEKDVVIDYNAPQDADSPDPAGVSIHASIIAGANTGSTDSSFYVENYSYGIRGVLTVFGGIIQKSRGPVGTFNAATNQKVSGYDKNYQYDDRFLASPPLYFPLTNDYEIISWKEQ